MVIKSKFKSQKLKAAAVLTALVVWATTSCNNEGNKAPNTTTTPVVNNAPAVMQYQVLNEFPHDTKAFTEGLQFVDGILYESTGEYGTSDVRKTDLKTGKVIASTKMDNKYFGEGLTILNGKIYQLTYREHTGFVYDAKTLEQLSTFSFSSNEGWGMTNDGTYLIYDDGSNLLHYLEPATFKEVKTLHVSDENGAVDNINELEFIKGFIYANQWKTGNILKIDTASGQVVARADLSALGNSIGIGTPAADGSRGPDVLNGIAYDAANNRIFVTGKNWPKLFEVKLDN